MPEPYAQRANEDGTTTKYWRKRDYLAARFQAMGTRAATRERINRKIGGNVV